MLLDNSSSICLYRGPPALNRLLMSIAVEDVWEEAS